MSSSSSQLRSIFTVGAAATLAAAAVAAGYYYYSQKQEETKPTSSSSRKENTSSKKAAVSIPVIDFNIFFNKDQDPASYQEECAKVAEALHQYGLVIVKDPRVSGADNERFLSMMEKYFEQSDGVRDARPQFDYQVGVTGERIEKPRDHSARINSYGPEDKPQSASTPDYDPKWRFFWRVGPVPEKTEFPVQNMDPVLPEGFPEWKEVMDMWGGKMISAVFTLAEMAAVGFHMPADAFTKRMEFGPHLLAPTGSNFNKYNKVGTVLAGFHYDLNFLTIHGKSRFPGLFVWTRDGTKTPVSVPDGCLLVQAGKQIEYLTGGHVMAGFHEVVITDATKKVIDTKKEKGESLWRVSSTLFSQIQSDQILSPLSPFDSEEAKKNFPEIKSGHQVQKELEAISLARTTQTKP